MKDTVLIWGMFKTLNKYMEILKILFCMHTSPQNAQYLLNVFVCDIIMTSGKLLLKELSKINNS